MSARSTLYAIDLSGFQQIDRRDAEEYVGLATKELTERYGSLNGYDIEVLKHIFGLQRIERNVSRSVIVPMRWICINFGTRIFWNELPPIYELEIDSPLEYYAPPFDLPKGDECVAHMTLKSIITERVRLDECDQELLRFDGAEAVLETRHIFLKALDYCIDRKMDMVVIES